MVEAVVSDRSTRSPHAAAIGRPRYTDVPRSHHAINGAQIGTALTRVNRGGHTTAAQIYTDDMDAVWPRHIGSTR
ncbi:unnamed protein product, partial [Iphiclides podalirius]